MTDHYSQYLHWRDAIGTDVARLLRGLGSREALAPRLVSYPIEAKAKVLAIAKFDRGDAAKELLRLLFEIHSDPFPCDNWQTETMETALKDAASFGNAEMFANLLEMSAAFYGVRIEPSTLEACLSTITICNPNGTAARMLTDCLRRIEDPASALRRLTAWQLRCAWRDAVDAGRLDLVRILYAPVFERFDGGVEI